MLPLDLADGVGVFAELALVAGTDVALQPREAAGDVIENALLISAGPCARRVSAFAVAEQPLEDRARVNLRWQRAGLRPP